MYGSSRTIMKEVKKKVTAVVLTTAIGVTSVSALADFDKETSNTGVNDTNITEVTATPEAVNEPIASPTIEPTASPTIEPTVTPTDDNSESTLTPNDDKAPFEDLNNNNPLNEYVSDDDFGISLFSGKKHMIQEIFLMQWIFHIHMMKEHYIYMVRVLFRLICHQALIGQILLM